MSLVAKRVRKLGATALLAFPLALGACSDSSRTPSPGSPGPTGQAMSPASTRTAGPTAPGPSAAPPPLFEKLPNLLWIGEGPDGWLAGELGVSYRRLPENEIGLVARDGWILSVAQREASTISLLVRRGLSDDDVRVVELGNLLPSSVVIANDVAYLSGVPAGVAEDMRSYRIALGEGSLEPGGLIKADAGNVVRNLAISSDGATLASSLCVVTDDFTVEGCRLQRIADATLFPVSDIPGLLALTSPDVAIVVDPVGDSEPSWIAGFEVQLENVEPGAEKPLWQVDGQIQRWRIDERRAEVVVARFESGETPRFVVEAVALGSGERTVLYEVEGDTPPAFWTDQSTDDFLVLASEPDIASAAAERADGLVPVLIIDRTTGSVDPYLLSIGKAT